MGGCVGVLGEQQHAGGGACLADQPDQLGHAGAGHVGVDHQHVRLVGDHRLQGRGAVAGEGDDLQVVLGVQHHAEALHERVVVVRQDDPDGLPQCRSPRAARRCSVRC
ncbi:MAG TPA: hypothetical protein VFL71_07280 [Actinomycetes bacterium]|nr:hypothetical protein [Actinomycetes bacterium]